ncbi:MAG: hypothetical protein N5P05_004439 (plasmid) [Chroococcopsis gigantea SAG 12.99]|jgi:hypothetical protein|nr:hypothetical protein [Chlorogloea purpurea SAG 13.99]MDV3002784.1 hypothetical protein [Chroococcopsis gigantea SAG 12.99]
MNQQQIEEMLEWFYENYEDPAEAVPYDTGEGGYQYYNGAPYDPMEVLMENFPDVPSDEIEFVAHQIYGERGSEFVKVGEY